MRIRGMAYVPGCVHGVLRRGIDRCTPDAILLIGQDDIPRLTGLPAGILLVDGAPFSHRMIGLLGLGVPTVAIDPAQAQRLEEGMDLLLDGASGLVESPAPDTQPPGPPPSPAPGEPVLTADGIPVHLHASIRSLDAARQALRAGAAGIGLVRSEYFAPQDGSRPDRDYWRHTLAELCKAVSPLRLTLRLLDASADKRPAWLPAIEGYGGNLGLEGARLFGEPVIREVIEAQLAAVRELAGQYDIEVLIPYLTRHEELRHWRDELGPLIPAPVPVGAMVETPAAALDMAQWSVDADFVAVGCNDLMQCLFAADRDSPATAAYLDPYAPVLYRLLKQMADGMGPRIDRVRLCGVLPQLQGVLPLLIGLGYRHFSVDPAHIPYMAFTIRGQTVSAATSLAEQACRARASGQVLQALDLPDRSHPPYRP